MGKKSAAEKMAQFSRIFDPIFQIDTEISHHERQIKKLEERRREEINRQKLNKGKP
ncbi:hypothetical protein [Rosenbergiella australiborealis]|uniref:hypothetical protein n=1 Tax=Rosenbergiella australiborealis TaxID=1544696 RepID=UPI001F4D5671|nr:hypothetical protein [Rosenbergiella australiborealis]